MYLNRDKFSAAALADGGWLVTWLSYGQDGDGNGIYQQRYDADGVASGTETLVNSYTANEQYDPSVTALADGGWVVTWTSYGQDGDGYGIYQQRYAADGVASGTETLVNSYTTSHQYTPSVTSLADGGWVVTWTSHGQDGDDNGIYQQRYDADGVASGTETLVNSYFISNQRAPSVTALADGGWLVTWQSDGQDGDAYGIYQQRYDADGAASGTETLVNSYTTGQQSLPSVTALADGSWLVTWSSENEDGDSFGIYQRHFAADKVGTADGETLTGTHWSETIYGEGGNDTLNGGSGDDYLYGAAGDDTYIVDDIGDVVTELDGEGTDTVETALNLYTLGDYVENLTLTGTADAGFGNELDNILTGNSGANSLYGYDGNDMLDGGGGADNLYGYDGNDTYIVDDARDGVYESDGEGTDTVRASISYALGDYVENLVLTGADNIDATGNGLANTLTGNAGDNTLDGGEEADTIIGGAGDDTYVVDDAGDVVTELDGEGTDTVETTLNGYTLGDHVENLTLTGTADIAGYGNELDNILTGNSGANNLYGYDGNDTYILDDAGDGVYESDGEGTDTVRASISYTLTGNVEDLTLTGSGDIHATGNGLANTLTGNAGDNVLNGGAGADRLAGGAGDDTYVVDDAGDVVTELDGEGTDTVVTTLHGHTLGEHVENVTLAGTADIAGYGNEIDNILTGNSGANQLFGSDGNDTLDGGGGADFLYGGADDDTYVVDDAGDVVTEYDGEGTDMVRASISYTLGNYIENLTLTGTGDIDATGNGLANTLTGNAGDNVLNGGAGADTLAGGAGDDSYVVDDTDDVVTEIDSEGTDLITSSVSYTLGSNVENLVLTGTGNLDATGNGLANTITGTSGNNILDGGTGADTLIGGAGDDNYVVDEAGDVVTELNDEGTDTVSSSLGNHTLGNFLENLILTGTADLRGSGNGLANTLTGNIGGNRLSGLGGADTLDGGDGEDIVIGGKGEDALSGGRGADTFVFARGDTSASKAKADTILDMRGRDGDRIDLHLIDANEDKGGNQKFDFIGTGRFTGDAGELRYEKKAGDTYIYGDTDGDRKIDFAVHLDGAMNLKDDFFVL